MSDYSHLVGKTLAYSKRGVLITSVVVYDPSYILSFRCGEHSLDHIEAELGGWVVVGGES